MPGYDENFLKTPVPLPTFSMHLDGRVLRRDGLREGVYRDYINYSLAMHTTHKSPIFAALNIDQARLRSVRRGGWNIDDVIGAENQLDNAYYYRNRWDRGHIARRASAAWGQNDRAAKQASDSTMFFTNACLQFDSFNQDEWLDLENWVKDLTEDNDDKITVFSGPVYGDDPLFVVPEHRNPAEVPAGFFKVVCFTDKDGAFAVRAFHVPQDQKAMADWQGRNRVNRQTYQTTIAEIEHLTGIEFPPIIGERNPLLFHDSPENNARKEELKIEGFPENIPVDRREDMRATDEPRAVLADNEVDVFIAGAMPNPKGRDRGNEWVSIISLEAQTIDLEGWTLSDNHGSATLSGKLQPGVARRLQGATLGTVQLSNKADILTLSDADGRRIDRVRWLRGDVREGEALVFAGYAGGSWAAASRYPISRVDTSNPQP